MRPGGRGKRRNPFRVLVGALISARTRDRVTGEATARLLAIAPDSGSLAALPARNIARALYPAGFHRTKARHLKALGGMLCTKHGGRVPRDAEALRALPGVGPKVAALTLAEGHGIPAVCADIHVHRISNRLGLIRTREPEQTQEALTAVLPRRLWTEWNRLLVPFGQSRCGPRPRCQGCPAMRFCETGGKWCKMARREHLPPRQGGRA